MPDNRTPATIAAACLAASCATLPPPPQYDVALAGDAQLDCRQLLRDIEALRFDVNDAKGHESRDRTVNGFFRSAPFFGPLPMLFALAMLPSSTSQERRTAERGAQRSQHLIKLFNFKGCTPPAPPGGAATAMLP